MQTSTILTILAAVVGLAGAVSQPLLEQVFPGHGTYAAGIIALVGIVAAAIINAIKAQAPASSIIANAPVVAEGTVLAPPKAPNGGPTVLSTTSELLPGNQAKG